MGAAGRVSCRGAGELCGYRASLSPPVLIRILSWPLFFCWIEQRLGRLWCKVDPCVCGSPPACCVNRPGRDSCSLMRVCVLHLLNLCMTKDPRRADVLHSDTEVQINHLRGCSRGGVHTVRSSFLCCVGLFLGRTSPGHIFQPKRRVSRSVHGVHPLSLSSADPHGSYCSG